jgi:hypothetical protein
MDERKLGPAHRRSQRFLGGLLFHQNSVAFDSTADASSVSNPIESRTKVD